MSKDLIVLSDYPQASGVYWFVNNNEIIYIGSSKNIYNRIGGHKTAIKKGSARGYKQDFYQFLQNNPFTIQYQLTEDYRQLEQELIEIHQPIFNAYRAFTGLGAYKDNEAEYNKEWQQKYHDEYLELLSQYREEHKKEIQQYRAQLCNYNNEVLTLDALRKRFAYRGIEHSTAEAKKYLVAAGDNSNE